MQSKKTKEELREDVEKQQQDKFIKEVQDVENKHGYKLKAILHYSYHGVIPQITVEKHIVVEKDSK